MRHQKIKSRLALLMDMPFICLFKPFVGLNNPVVFPFIRKKIPFVGISGFTLIELVITLTVAGILLTVAAPSMSRFLANNRLSAQINDLSADISLARAEAIKRNTTTGICTSNTGTGCVAGNWEDGWIVYYVCPTGDPSCAVGNNIVVSVHEALTGGNTLAGAATQILYDRTAVLTAGNGTYTLCDSKLGKTRIITLNQVGRPTISEGAC